MQMVPLLVNVASHHAHVAASINIVAYLDLRAVDPGTYELTAGPLKIADADGSPIRAFLRTRQGASSFNP